MAEKDEYRVHNEFLDLTKDLDSFIDNSDVSLFDYMTIIFQDTEQYNRMSNSVKSAYFFALRRRVAIANPEYAQSINFSHTDAVEASNHIHRYMCNPRYAYARHQSGHLRKPQWMFEKGLAKFKSKIEKNGEVHYEDFHRKMLCDVYDLDSKMFNKLVEDYPIWLQTQVDRIDYGMKGRIRK